MTVTVAAAVAATMAGAVGVPVSQAADDIPAKGAGSTKPHTYIVEMALDPVAGHERVGSVNPADPAVVDYAQRLKGRQRAALAKVTDAKPLYDYVYTFNGFAAKLTDDQATELAGQPGVLAVDKDELRTVDTASTESFLGLDKEGGLWDQLGGPVGGKKTPGAGEDVVIGVIDSGIWPDARSFSDRDKDGKLVYLGKPRGFRGTCASADTVGDDSWDSNKCNNKLVTARYYDEGWGGNAGLKQELPWEFASPRDYNGHGTHTASTSGGNYGVDVTGPAKAFGQVTGIAPRARIAAYKALWSAEDGSTANGYTTDLVAAIDQAVADGVDVINYSVSGSSTNFLDPVEVAFMNAADAGVFVAASAGNSGPQASTVAHPSPWVTTVAAGTHDHAITSTVTLGNGDTYTGASVADAAVGPLPFIDGAQAALDGADKTLAARCYSAADNGGKPVLDPAKVKGKIVLCEREGLVARVNKSQAVADAGGAGVILANSSQNSLNADFHAVPTVHVADTALAELRAYADTDGATASIAAATIQDNVDAPYTADFSSRGPLIAGSGDLLKPDLMAPGQDILAAVAPPGQNGMDFNLMSGTSMSAPHVAGLAALLDQRHPDWTPMMVKSALMTTGYDVRDGDPTDPSVIFSQGAGHVRPNSAADPGLVYDSTEEDWLAFLCGASRGVVQSVCNDLRESGHSLDPSDLNSPSIAIGLLGGSQTVTRTVTNVGSKTATYTSSIKGLKGIDATVKPSTLTLAPGESASYEVTFTQQDATLFTYIGGYLTWTDGTHDVRSPIVLRARAKGSENWEAHYDGPGGSFGMAGDEGQELMMHPDGTRLYVGGTSTPPVPGTLVQDFVTAAYDPKTGDELWSARYDGSNGGSDEPGGFAMSPDGETVYATGTSGGDFVTIAYDGATGAQKWETKTDGPAGKSDIAEDISVTPDGRTVLVTGSQTMTDDGRDFATAAYDAATGQQRWVSNWDDPVHDGDYGTAMAVSADSSTVVMTGQSMGTEGRSYDWGIVAYDVATGKQVWDAQYNGPASKGDIPNDIAITGSGTVVVTGSAAVAGTGNDWGVVGYDLKTGEEQWSSTYDGTRSTDVPRAIAVSPDDSTVVVTGNSWGSGTGSDYATVAFDAATGAQRWAARHNGSANGLDISWNLAISKDSSRVVVTGQTAESQTGTDYTTIANDMGTGEEVWKAQYDATRSFDGGNAVAIDSAAGVGRRVFVTGVSTNSIDPLNDNADAVTLGYFDPFE